MMTVLTRQQQQQAQHFWIVWNTTTKDSNDEIEHDCFGSEKYHLNVDEKS